MHRESCREGSCPGRVRGQRQAGTGLRIHSTAVGDSRGQQEPLGANPFLRSPDLTGQHSLDLGGGGEGVGQVL